MPNPNKRSRKWHLNVQTPQGKKEIEKTVPVKLVSIYYCTAQIATYMKFNMEAFNMQSVMSIEDVNGKLFKLELGP